MDEITKIDCFAVSTDSRFVTDLMDQLCSFAACADFLFTGFNESLLSMSQRLLSNELMEVQGIETDRINHLQKSTKLRKNGLSLSGKLIVKYS